MNFMYLVKMDYANNNPIVLYRFDKESLSEEFWNSAEQAWIDCPNEIVESLFVSGDLDQFSEENAQEAFPEAFVSA